MAVRDVLLAGLMLALLPLAIGAAEPAFDSERPLWTTSRVRGFPEPPPPYEVEPAFPNLDIPCPIYLKREPGSDRWFLIHQTRPWSGPCRIQTFVDDPQVSETELQLAQDQLIYGLTFHPDYERNGYLYVVSNGPLGAENKQNRITRYTVDRQPPHRLLPETELVILQWDSNGHNGGDIAFGPDGLLYFATGDGTSDSDINLTGQGLDDLLSVMVRIDVDHPTDDKPYSIPPDNPFLDVDGARPEIWALGFRNPWRLTFDQRTGHLWVGNNGQDLWEQVYFVRKGENYGWSVTEGGHPFQLQRKQGPGPIVEPTIEHPHSEARSLTGGVVYYGEQLPELQGTYVYGDFSTGRIWGARHDGEQLTWQGELARTTLQITGFALSPEGDLLIVDHGGGLYRLVPRERSESGDSYKDFPRKLSETGLFTSVARHELHPGVIPYSVNSPLWSDGAKKQRFIALPDDAKIEVPTPRGWNFDEGTVLVKTFSLELEAGNPASTHHIETRLLTKTEGQWYGYSYLWNNSQTDARLVDAGGLDREFEIKDSNSPDGVRMQSWHYPSRTECMVCHTRAANFVLGPTDLQMNKWHDYGQVEMNQLRMLEKLDVFRVNYKTHVDELHRYAMWPFEQLMRPAMIATPRGAEKLEERVAYRAKAWRIFAELRKFLPTPLLAAEQQYKRGHRALVKSLSDQPRYTTLRPKRPSQIPHLIDPYDDSQPIDARARSYLHVNCATCHVTAGGGNAMIKLDWPRSTGKMNLVDVVPEHDQFGIAEARLIAPGVPEHSILYQRVARRGRGQMPPIATSELDAAAVELIHQWISQMPEERDERREAGDE